MNMQQQRVSNDIRPSHSAGQMVGSLFPPANSPYNRPSTSSAAVNSNDNSSLVWKDFLQGAKKRKLMMQRLREAGQDGSIPITNLKKILLELRQNTLKLIEDALEIEYRKRVESRSRPNSKSEKKSKRGDRQKLPPISSFRTMEDKEDIYTLVDIINDGEDLFTIPNIRVMLPIEFPATRNPFMLSKTIDELAAINPPHPQAGNLEEELKVLELLRYKRASRALIRAEAQVLNKLPIELYGLEQLLERQIDDINLEMLLRSVCTLIDNDGHEYREDPDLTCLLRPVFDLEAHDILFRLNSFRGVTPIRIDVQIAVRQALKDCVFDYLSDPTSIFLIEWLQIVLGSNGSSLEFQQEDHDSLPFPEGRTSLPPSRYGRRSLGTIAEVLSPAQLVDQAKIPIRVTYNGEYVDEDMVSEVDSLGYINTHEKIFDPHPIEKMKPRSFSPVDKEDATLDQIGLPKPRIQREDNTHLKDNSTTGQQHINEVSPSTIAESEEPKSSKVDGTNKKSVGINPVVTEFSSEAKETSLSKEPLKMQRSNRKFSSTTIVSQQSLDDSTEPMPLVPVVQKRKVRAEVEKILKELGYGGGLNEGGVAGVNTINSVRYELNKLQAELLRRQVLDPRYYALESVDEVSHSKRGLTKASDYGLDGQKKTKASQAPAPVVLTEKTISLPMPENGDMMVKLSIKLDFTFQRLICTISTIKQEAFVHKLINELPMGRRAQEEYFELAYFIVSKLMFSRVSDGVFDEFIDAKPETKRKMLQNISLQLEATAKSDPLPRGAILFKADRTLLHTETVQDNVAVDVLISRNDECTGLLFRIIPTAGLVNAKSRNIGPIVLTMSDNELEVLLINQHGLFEQAMSKWSAMQTVANWLLGRIYFRKIIADYSITDNQQSLMKTTLTHDKAVENSLDNKDLVMQSSTYNPELMKTIEQEAQANTLLLLDVKIQSYIEISSSIIEHWKQRNVSKIVGLDIQVNAWQDLEVLVISVKLNLPNKKTYHEVSSAAKRSDGLLDLTYHSEDDHDHDGHADHPADIELTYRLTRTELLTFGATVSVENKKISASKNTKAIDDVHPEGMLWNIFNRLHVTFRVSSTPYIFYYIDKQSP